MPDFLSMLRQKNTFPLGRPDTGDDGIGSAVRQVVPLVNNLKDRDMQRQREMMQFQAAQSRKDFLFRNQKPQQYLNPDTPTSGRMNSAPPVPGGFSPMQKMFQAREQDDRNYAQRSSLQQNENTSRYNQAMAETRLKSEGEMQRLAAEINARSQEGGLDRTSREKIAQDALKAKTGETAQEYALRLRMNNDDNAAARERTVLSGQNAIDVANARPSGFGDQYEQQVQDFKINFPDYANRLTFDPDSKRWGVNLDGLTPEAKAVIQRRLTPRPPSRNGNTGVRK